MATEKADFFELYIPEPNSGCWIWLAGTQNNGRYGAVTGMTAHHYSHLIHKGKVPTKWHVDHLCRNGLCVNPDHLEAVPCGLNVQRAYTHCKHGHLLGGDNAILLSRNNHGRRCKTCHKLRQRKYRANPMDGQ